MALAGPDSTARPYPFTMLSPLPAKAQWLGFLAGASTLLLVSAHYWKLTLDPFSIAATVAVSAAAIHAAGQLRSFPFWATLTLFLSVLAAHAFVYVRDIQHTETLTMLSVPLVTLALLLTFRPSPIAYAALALAHGLLAAHVHADLLIGAATFLLATIVFILTNYLAMLVLEHRKERRTLLQAPATATWAMMARALLIWSIAPLLAVTGNHFYQSITDSGIGWLYTNKHILPAPSPTEQISTLQTDIQYTLYLHSEREKEDLRKEVNNASDATIVSLAATPKAAEDFIETLRPANLPSGPLCEGFRYRSKWVSFSFTSPCRGLVNGINGLIQSSFETSKHKTIERTLDLSRRATNRITATRTTLVEDGVSRIDKTHLRITRYIDLTFIAVYFLRISMIVLLVISLVASFLYVIGRILYDDSIKPSQSFKTTGSAAPPQKIAPDLTGSFVFAQYDSTVPWFVKHSRKVQGECADYWPRKPLQCVVQRLISRTYFMSRVDPIGTGGKPNPQYVTAAPKELMVISLDEQQEVCVRLPLIEAFSDQVKFHSNYTTYLGASLLGLGTFFCTVRGPGYLVLEVSETRTRVLKVRDSTDQTRICVWDVGTEFKLDQRATFGGIWFHAPHLTLVKGQGSVILDDGRRELFPFIRNILRLVRYLVSPF